MAVEEMQPGREPPLSISPSACPVSAALSVSRLSYIIKRRMAHSDSISLKLASCRTSNTSTAPAGDDLKFKFNFQLQFKIDYGQTRSVRTSTANTRNKKPGSAMHRRPQWRHHRPVLQLRTPTSCLTSRRPRLEPSERQQRQPKTQLLLRDYGLSWLSFSS